MMLAGTIEQIDQYWAGQLAISPDVLRSSGLLVLALPEPSASHCFVFQRQAFTCIYLPSALYGHLHETIRQQDPAILLTPSWWQRALAAAPHQAIGPAYLGYADAQQFRPAIRHPARLLTSADSAALALFADAIGPIAWEHSGLGKQPQPIAGCWGEERLVAAAGYTTWGATIAHIGVATDPAAGGQGYGRSVVSAIGEHALEHGYALQYRTLLANSPSMAIARALGFQAYAITLFIALDAAPDS
jgi:RimJ/RimL family protein N-acetyltransferase